MISHINDQFYDLLNKLPPHIRNQARQAYRLFQKNPFHPSLQFKQVHPTKPVYSARIGRGYRALGVREKDVIIWFWIGSHTEYDKLISRL